MLLDIKLNLHPINFIIISCIVQNIILAGVLVFYKKGNRRANRFIGLFVLICSVHFAWPLMIDSNLGDIFNQVFWFPYSYLLAIGPLLFFYTKSLTESNFQISIKESIHFLPALAEMLIQLFFIKESIGNNMVPLEARGFLMFRIIEFAGTGISILVYGKKSLSLIKIHEARLVENFSNQRDITLSWLFKLIKYLRVLWIFWLAFELSLIVFLQFQMHLTPVYLLLYFLLGVITYSNYWIGIQALNKSEVLIEKEPVSRLHGKYKCLLKAE